MASRSSYSHFVRRAAAARSGISWWHCSISGGIYLLVHPTLGLIGLTLAMAVFFFVEGVMELANYISTRASNGSQLLLLHGIASLLLGLVIVRRWPISSLWAVGTLVGIGMIMTGVTRLMMARAVRKTQPA